MKVLQISPHYEPNMGGVETHLNDLVSFLVRKKWQVFVLTYTPLTTEKKAAIYEAYKNLIILRIPWIGGLFYFLVNKPLLEFIYLLPGLFFVIPFIINKFEVIHAHGLVAGFVAVFWGKLFRKKVIISTHNMYVFPKRGLYRNFAKWIFNEADFCLCLSRKSKEELRLLGIKENKVRVFTYWIDLNKFKMIKNAKNILGWDNKFMVLFVGRLIAEKGIVQLLEASKKWNKKINLAFIGSGPLEDVIKSISSKYKNISYLGLVNQNELSKYYSGADLTIVPSTSEEGFGRVILESLACGTSVIASNRGAIEEALDNTVGKLIKASSENIKQVVEYYSNHRNELKKLSKKCREFAERRYSEKNVNTIIQSYTN